MIQITPDRNPPAVPQVETPALFDAVGGAPTFARIVDNFYKGVEGDPLLRPMYPADLSESRRTMTLFLIQFWGGPSDYSQERGHPRLRMRHAPFAIGQAERDAWLKHMTAAIEAEQFPDEIREPLLKYFDRTATFMMNR